MHLEKQQRMAPSPRAPVPTAGSAAAPGFILAKHPQLGPLGQSTCRLKGLSLPLCGFGFYFFTNQQIFYCIITRYKSGFFNSWKTFKSYSSTFWNVPSDRHHPKLSWYSYFLLLLPAESKQLYFKQVQCHFLQGFIKLSGLKILNKQHLASSEPLECTFHPRNSRFPLFFWITMLMGKWIYAELIL